MFELPLFFGGYLAYLIRHRTPARSYQAMRELHAITDGRFNDAWLWLARKVTAHRPAPVNGFLGSWSVEELESIARTLESEGIAVLHRRVPEELCTQLEAFARTTPCMPMGLPQEELYSLETARALRYDFAPSRLQENPLASSIARDGTCAAIAGAYFRVPPVFDFLTMWWTTGKGERDFSGAAQQFHYDMDRLFFLKFFIYLTDVGPDNGPHVYVANSHRRKPHNLREDRRFTDQEITESYPDDRIRRITGPRGTMFVADTRGLHKGEAVRHGERLVLQVEYTLNRFGQNY